MGLDEACFQGCVPACPPGEDDCIFGCAAVCEGGTCAEICDSLCDGPSGDCRSDCVPSCEDFQGPDPDPTPMDPTPMDPTPPPPSGGTGTCRPSTRPASDGGSPPPPAEEDAGTTQPVEWVGTWNERVSYTARCMWSSAGAPTDSNQTFSVTARLSGANSDLSAVFSGNSAYTMTGTGSDEGLTLSGPFPGRDHRDNTATTVARDNNVTITIDEVMDASNARGRIEGSYETSGGIGCSIQSDGTVELTR